MRDRRLFPILVLLLSVIATPLAFAIDRQVPVGFNPALDGKPVYATNAASGAVWSAWSYRSHGEFDLAISYRDTSGTWSDPVFLGRLDGLDQVSPALVSDAAGHLYIAYAVRQTSQIFLSVLPSGEGAWSTPMPVTPREDRYFSPALAVVADRLVVGVRAFDGKVALRDLPLYVPVNGSLGIYDNPDGTDPLGMENREGSPPVPTGGFGPLGGGNTTGGGSGTK
jgi:hypothetical protein